MTVSAVLLANLDDAYERRGWHGTNLRGALRGLALDRLVWRPSKGRKNIWELTLHAAYWKYTVWRRLTGQKRGSFPVKGSNFFPSPSRPTESQWRDVISVLDSAHRQLRDAIAALSPRELKNAKTVRMLYGVAAHDLYHTGQIQLLKRLQP